MLTIQILIALLMSIEGNNPTTTFEPNKNYIYTVEFTANSHNQYSINSRKLQCINCD